MEVNDVSISFDQLELPRLSITRGIGLVITYNHGPMGNVYTAASFSPMTFNLKRSDRFVQSGRSTVIQKSQYMSHKSGCQQQNVHYDNTRVQSYNALIDAQVRYRAAIYSNNRQVVT